MSDHNNTGLIQATVGTLLQTTASAYSLPAKVAIGLAASLVMVMIIVGNTLVCIAVITERKLRLPQNWFLVSLAASDLLVGTIIMPFSLAYELMGYWAFGPVWCEIWLAMDVFACTASIFNLCLIALERYRCVVNPTAYSSPTINRRQGFLIACAYVTAAGISLPPLFGWAVPHEQHDALPVCPLRQSLGYVAFSVTASFYIPLVATVIAYICLIVATRKHLRKKLTHCPQPSGTPRLVHTTPQTPHKIEKKNENGHITLNKVGGHLKPTVGAEVIHLQVFSSSPVGTGSTRCLVGSAPADSGHATPTIGAKDPADKNGECGKAATILATADRDGGGDSDSSNSSEHLQDDTGASKENGNGKQFAEEFPARCAIEVVEDSSLQAQRQSSCINACHQIGSKLELQLDRNRREEPRLSPGQERMKMLQSKERRFTLIIGLVMGAFIVCWYPFFQLYPIVVACESCRVPPIVFKFFFWIGYCNSAVNPIIYTIFNQDFRVAFLRIITCGFRNGRAHVTR